MKRSESGIFKKWYYPLMLSLIIGAILFFLGFIPMVFWVLVFGGEISLVLLVVRIILYFFHGSKRDETTHSA